MWRKMCIYVQCVEKPTKSAFMFLYPRSPKGEGGILFYLCPSVLPSVQDIFLSYCWWQKSDIWSQASYMYTILWVMFLRQIIFFFTWKGTENYGNKNSSNKPIFDSTMAQNTCNLVSNHTTKHTDKSKSKYCEITYSSLFYYLCHCMKHFKGN
jgi:hypothetical protein